MPSEAQEAVDRVWLVLDTVSSVYPNMPLHEAVKLVQDTYCDVEWRRENGHSTPPPAAAPSRGPLSLADMSDRTKFGTWLAGEKVVTQFILDGKKINAIKEARALTGAGLKDTKEAVEWLTGNWRLFSSTAPASRSY